MNEHQKQVEMIASRIDSHFALDEKCETVEQAIEAAASSIEEVDSATWEQGKALFLKRFKAGVVC